MDGGCRMADDTRVRMTLTLSPELHAKLTCQSEVLGLTATEYIRMMLAQGALAFDRADRAMAAGMGAAVGQMMESVDDDS